MKELLEQILENQKKILDLLAPKPSKKAKDELFENAWVLYERKGSKKVSKGRWNKLSAADKNKVLLTIPIYFDLNPDFQFRKDFERFISNELYNDLFEQLEKQEEIAIKKEKKKVFKLENEGFLFDD